jgi:phosphoribosylformylglycinamidine synthase PurS subunit
VSEATQTATMWLARIHVTLKPAVVDPQGDTILSALHQLHFADVQGVRMGKYLEVTLQAADEAAARDRVDAMCRTLLANPVIERYAFAVEPAPDALA